jgi:hypothetical protein
MHDNSRHRTRERTRLDCDNWQLEESGSKPKRIVEIAI